MTDEATKALRKALSDLADAATAAATAAFPSGSPPEFSELMRRTNDAYSRGLRAVEALEECPACGGHAETGARHDRFCPVADA